MTDPAVAVGVGRAPGGVLKGRRLLASVTLAWSITLAGMAWADGWSLINFIGPMIIVFSPIPWLHPLWMLPRAPGSVSFAAPFLLFLVPVVLVTSAYMASQPLKQALHSQRLADSAHRDGLKAHLPHYEYGYRTHIVHTPVFLQSTSPGRVSGWQRGQK